MPTEDVQIRIEIVGIKEQPVTRRGSVGLVRNLNLQMGAGRQIFGLTVGGDVEAVRIVQIRTRKSCLEGKLFTTGNWTAISGVRIDGASLDENPRPYDYANQKLVKTMTGKR